MQLFFKKISTYALMQFPLKYAFYAVITFFTWGTLFTLNLIFRLSILTPTQKKSVHICQNPSPNNHHWTTSFNF